MRRSYKRRRYLIEKGLQLRFMGTFVGTLFTVMLIAGLGLYFGIWGSIIEAFSSVNVSQDLETAKRISAYEAARFRTSDTRLMQIFKEADLLSSRQREQLSYILGYANARILPKVIMLVFLIAFGSIFLSHRVAGPVYRFEKCVKAIGEGDLGMSFKLRKGDELKGLATSLDEMTQTLRSRVINVRRIIADSRKSSVTKNEALERIERELEIYKI